MDAVLAWAHEHIRHVVAALLLLARLGDIGTTWLATPTLALEANPVVRKLGWWFAVPTVLLFLVPYVNLPLGTEWGFWFGWAVVVYAIAIALHGTAFIVRLFRDAGRGRA